MRAGPVGRAVRGGVARRRVQTIVIALVLLVSTGAAVLALALVVDSSAPFDHSFAAQRGAHLAAVVDPARATPADLAATTRLKQVTATAGPFAALSIAGQLTGQAGPDGSLPPMTLAGRSGPGGRVDDLTLQSGHWADGPGQLVLAVNSASDVQIGLPLGAKITVLSTPGHPVLTVVGEAASVTNSADGWVMPGEIARLRPAGTPGSEQMLYRFRNAGNAAAVRADAAAVSRALPSGAVTAVQSYLTVREQETSQIGPFVPFLVAFGVIGLVMSVLIVANVVSGAVVSGYRRIGILKSIGFTPGQVVAAYTVQVAVPALVGVVGGLVVGDLLATMLLRQAANAYGVGQLSVPVWVDMAVPVAMLGLVAIAALLPAMGAARLSAVQAIAAGRAPRAGRGYAAHRLSGRLRLPRPVTIGLAAPFARPARTAITLVAVLLGAAAVTFAVGLGSSLNRVVGGLSHAASEPVQVYRNSQNSFIFSAAQQRTVQAALAAQPGTRRYVAETDNTISVAGLTGQHPLTAFRGPAAWTGYPIISGHWYTGPGQAVVSTGFLTLTGKAVGGTVTIVLGGRPIPLRIVGEDFDAQNRGVSVITDWQTLADAHVGPALTAPGQYDIGVRPGVSPAGYAQSLGTRLGSSYSTSLNTRNSVVVSLMLGLIGTLTVLLALVAGLGVLNTVVLNTRDRVHDLGVFKAIGMMPRQVIAMVVCWVAGTGLVAGLIALPAGIALHHAVLPVMASSANLGLPASYLSVYRGPELVVLALAGVVIAVIGALLPAGWAARIRTASALRAE
jgi:putative ABC transport system permease protein